jgi:hypothetical protein
MSIHDTIYVVMAVSVRTTRILGAVALSTVFIGGALVISNPNFSLAFLNPSIASAETTADLLKTYAQKDSDGDGLPDWQEALYGTDPHNAHSVSPTLTDGQAVAQGLVKPKLSTATASSSPADIQASIPGQLPGTGSLTEQFSQEFFTDVVNASAGDGSGISAADQQTLVTQLLGNFSQKAESMLVSNYNMSDIHTDSSVSVGDYTASVEQIIEKHDVANGAGNPVDLMQAYVQNNDASAQKKLITLATSYSAIAADLATTSVPPSLAQDDLNMLQAFDSLGKATNVVANYCNAWSDRYLCARRKYALHGT